MSRIHLTFAAAIFAAAATSVSAQGIASRVDGAPDGRVMFSFAARPGVCGNGRTYIQTGPNSITGTINYNGNYYGNVNDAMRADPLTWQPEGYPPDNITMCAPVGS